MNAIRVAYLVLFGLSAAGCFVGVWRATNIVDDDTRTGLVALLILSGIWAGTSVGRLLPFDPAIQTTFYLIGLVSGFAAVGAWLYFCSPGYSGTGNGHPPGSDADPGGRRRRAAGVEQHVPGPAVESLVAPIPGYNPL